MSPSVFSGRSQSRIGRSTMAGWGMAETQSNALRRSRTKLLGQELGRIRRMAGVIQGSSVRAPGPGGLRLSGQSGPQFVTMAMSSDATQ